MQIDWVKTIEDIFSNQVSCPRCGILSPQLVEERARPVMQEDLHVDPLIDYAREDGREAEQQLQLSDKRGAGAQTLDAMGQGLSRQPRHDHERSTEDARIAFRGE